MTDSEKDLIAAGAMLIVTGFACLFLIGIGGW